MSKRMYIIPETETSPLLLSACIMSGDGPDVSSDKDTQSGHFEAPRKRVF